jgi:hypothetical protein
MTIQEAAPVSQWQFEGGPEELRFVMWGIPHVIRKQDQYLICLQGLPPTRKLIHLAVIGKIGNVDSPDDVVAWVKRAGFFALMSKDEAAILSDRLRNWWAPPPLAGEPAQA